METTLTTEWQVTIPKHIQDSLSLKPGCRLTFDVNEEMNLVLRPNRPVAERRPDRFDRALGASEIKWEGTTNEYMELIRGYSDDPA